MSRTRWRIGLALILFGYAGTGCTRQAVHTKPPPPDPLLISKKPITGIPSEARDAMVRIEPPLPPTPSGDQWATAPLREAPPAVTVGWPSAGTAVKVP
jgi:hypothetical protein